MSKRFRMKRAAQLQRSMDVVRPDLQLKIQLPEYVGEVAERIWRIEHYTEEIRDAARQAGREG